MDLTELLKQLELLEKENEAIQQIILQIITPSNKTLLKLAKMYPPPQSWYDEEELPFDVPAKKKYYECEVLIEEEKYSFDLESIVRYGIEHINYEHCLNLNVEEPLEELANLRRNS